MEESENQFTIPVSLQHTHGFVLSKVAQYVHTAVDEGLESYGILAKHYGVMTLISGHGALAQIEIGNRLRIDRTTMVKLIDDLETLDWVERKRDPSDRRAYLVDLTKTGCDKLSELRAQVMETERKALSPLTSQERLQLQNLLIKVMNHDPNA